MNMFIVGVVGLNPIRSTICEARENRLFPHQIWEADLKSIVLDDLRRVTHLARMKERQFAQ